MSKKECQHEWLPLGNDRWGCKNCSLVRIGYVAELKHQLAEKDKEIKCIKMLLEAYRSQCHEFLKNETQFHNQIRHQICEEIKIKGHYYLNSRGEEYYEITPEMLWEIEKGE